MYRKWKNIPEIANAPRDKQGRKKLGYDTYLELVVKDEEVKDWMDRFDKQIELWKYFTKEVMPPKIGSLKILDCGAGDGLFAHYLTTAGHDVIGIDINEKYVEYAKSKGRPVVYGDTCHLEYPDETFDITYSHQVLGLVKDRKTAIRERLRVTKINGLLVALDGIKPNSPKHFQAVNKYQLTLMIEGIPNINIVKFDDYKNQFLIVLRRTE